MDKPLLQYYIHRKGMNADDLCKLIGMHPCTFSFKLNGKSDFTLSEIKKIMEVLDIEDPRPVFFTN